MSEQTTGFLVVEDNDLDLEKIVRGFSRLKIQNEVIRAENGIDALDVLRGVNGREKPPTPCVVLLDLNMPRMNGFEFLRELRDDPEIAHTPVFVLTTSDRQQDINKAYEYGVCGYIVKPIEVTQMFEALGTLNAYWKLCETPREAATSNG